MDKGVVARGAVETVWLLHPLLREVLVTQVAPGEDDAATHLAYAEVLGRTAGDDPVAAGDVSEHLAAGRDADGAFHWALVSADLAVEVGATTQACLSLAMATDLWSSVSDGARGNELDHVDLLRRAARAEWSTGVADRGSAWLDEAVSILERRDDPLLLAEVLLQRSGQEDIDFDIGSSAADLRRAAELVEGSPHSDTGVAVLSEYACAQWVMGDRAAATTTAGRVVELAVGAGPRALAWATYASAIVDLSSDRADRMGEAYHLAKSAGDPMCLAYTAGWWPRLLHDAERYDEQVAAADRAAADLRESGDLEGPKWLAVEAARTLIMTGDWARVRTLLRGPFATGTRSSGDVGLAWASALLGVRAGQIGWAARQFDRLLEFGAWTNWFWPLAQPVAELALATGRPWDALEVLDSRHEPDLFHRWVGPLHVALATTACADLAEEPVRPDELDSRALAALDGIKRWVDDVAAAQPGGGRRRHDVLWEARTAAEEARLRWALSDSSYAKAGSDCVDAFSSFRTHARRDGFPWEEAYAGLRLAEAMIRRQAPHGEVAAVLREAHARAVALGADHLAARLATLARVTRTSLEAVSADLGARLPVDPLTPASGRSWRTWWPGARTPRSPTPSSCRSRRSASMSRTCSARPARTAVARRPSGRRGRIGRLWTRSRVPSPMSEQAGRRIVEESFQTLESEARHVEPPRTSRTVRSRGRRDGRRPVGRPRLRPAPRPARPRAAREHSDANPFPGRTGGAPDRPRCPGRSRPGGGRGRRTEPQSPRLRRARLTNCSATTAPAGAHGGRVELAGGTRTPNHLFVSGTLAGPCCLRESPWR
ncbi:hypothetical protein UB45_11310 [Terrabacter sp. 28]|nr:hypothetical protein UB45_11310 [Terrabacter sp. 28]